MVAEVFELVDEVASASVRVVVAGEVVDADLCVDDAFVEHVPDDDQQGVSDSDEGSLLSSSFRDPPEPDGEVAVLGSHGCPCSFDER